MLKLFFMVATGAVCAISTVRGADSFPLWPDGAPGALGKEDKDIPTLTVYLPEDGQRNGSAVVICPGGGYGGLAGHEGDHYARFLNEHGVAGFVLKYRLGPGGYKHPSMLLDAQRAIRVVRSRAPEWKLDPRRIGIMGSSAGGHLASTALTHFDSGKPVATDPADHQSCRPDFGILCYAVITMGEYTHKGSRHNLLGENPSEELIKELSNELHATKQTPPCFIWHTWEDKAVPVENSLQFAAALRKAGVPFDLHIYQKGGHGIGLGSNKWDPANRHPWTADLVYWLKAQSVTASPH